MAFATAATTATVRTLLAHKKTPAIAGRGFIRSSLILRHERPVHASLCAASTPCLHFLVTPSLRYVHTVRPIKLELSNLGYETRKVFRFVRAPSTRAYAGRHQKRPTLRWVLIDE